MYVSGVLNPPPQPGGKWWVECRDDYGRPFTKEFDGPEEAVRFMEEARADQIKKILNEAGLEIFDGKITPRRRHGPFGSGAT